MKMIGIITLQTENPDNSVVSCSKQRQNKNSPTNDVCITERVDV